MNLLVLGDSLSDGGWRRDPARVGSAWPLALRELASESGSSVVPSVRAEAGSRSPEVLELARSLEPAEWDAVAVFAGANDVWRRWVPWNGQEPVDEDDFRRNLRSLAEVVRGWRARRLWILTPCLLDPDPDHPWNAALRGYREVCREVAALDDALLVPCGEEFEAAVRARPDVKWTYDGAHPRPVGHQRLAWTVLHRALGGPGLPASEIPPRPAFSKVRTWP